jgi:hypothetical protein
MIPYVIAPQNITNKSAKGKNALFFSLSQMNMNTFFAMICLLGLSQSLRIVV